MEQQSTQPIMSSKLTEQQFQQIHSFKIRYSKYNWDKLKNLLDDVIPDINNMRVAELKESYSIMKPSTFIKEDILIFDKTMPYSKLNSFFYVHKGPGQLIKKGPWSEEEENLFIKLVKEGVEDKTLTNCQWGIFSIRMPYRTGKQCYSKYKELLVTNIVPKLPKHRHSQEIIQSTVFTKSQEEILCRIIEQKISEGQGLTIKDVQKIIQHFYWKTTTLALRASTIIAARKGIDQFDDNDFRTDAFLELYRDIKQLAKEEPHVIDEMVDIPPFKASVYYVRSFLERQETPM